MLALLGLWHSVGLDERADCVICAQSAQLMIDLCGLGLQSFFTSRPSKSWQVTMAHLQARRSLRFLKLERAFPSLLHARTTIAKRLLHLPSYRFLRWPFGLKAQHLLFFWSDFSGRCLCMCGSSSGRQGDSPMHVVLPCCKLDERRSWSAWILYHKQHGKGTICA